MHFTVGTTPVPVDTVELSDSSQSGQVVVLQNLGPGSVYVDFSDDVSPATGLRLQVDDVYEFPRTSNEQVIFMVSSQANTDVRLLLVD